MHVHSPFESKAAAAGPGPSGLGRNLLHILLWAIILPIPMVLAATGAWVGSTLAVHHGQPVWVALVGAVLVFGVLPLLWELAADRHQVGGRVRDAILRSSFLSFVLIAVLLATHAKTTYQALATRGDWFLANARTPAAESIRRFVFKAADGFQWLDDWVRGVGYGWADTTGDIDPSSSAVSNGRRLRSLRNQAGAGPGEKPPLPRIPIDGTSHAWPLPDGPHPLVAEVIATNPESPAAVGKWLAEHAPDPFTRVVAIHDFVVTWIDYDRQGLVDGSYKERNRQEAGVVFRNRFGVCAGYANLFQAIAKAAGVEAVVVTGFTRQLIKLSNENAASLAERSGPPHDDAGHAWNAVRIDDRWHLVDPTWNDGGMGKAPERGYLFAPPEVLLTTHRPNDDKWQLLNPPVSYGEWLREPFLRPPGHHFGIRLANNERPVMARTEPFRLEIENPHQRRLRVRLDVGQKAASLEAYIAQELDKEAGRVTKKSELVMIWCDRATDASKAVFTCAAPPGRFEVLLWGESPEYEGHVYLGGFIVTPD